MISQRSKVSLRLESLLEPLRIPGRFLHLQRALESHSDGSNWFVIG